LKNCQDFSARNENFQLIIFIYIACKLILNLQGNVVCKQLGYPLGAETVSCCSAYGTVPTNFAYDNVQCVGTESTLDSCNHLNVHDCVSSEGAGVVCKRNGTTAPGIIFINIL